MPGYMSISLEESFICRSVVDYPLLGVAILTSQGLQVMSLKRDSGH